MPCPLANGKASRWMVLMPPVVQDSPPKFVIVTLPRSGSYHLVSLLNSAHPLTENSPFVGGSWSNRPSVDVDLNEATLIAECDPRRIEEVRRNWPFIRDRRIDAYAPLLVRWLG